MIFVFLRNVWATVIPSLALPFSIIGTFSVMYFLDYSLDNLSMMALILSVGFVVDDAIVMLENIFRHVEMGEDPLRGVARRIARNRLHDRLDDAVARGRVHPGAVHGRRARPAVPRVLGHDLRRDSDFRRRVGDADADAVQPLPEEAAQRTARAAAARGSTTSTERAFQKWLGALRPHAADRHAASAGDDGRVRARCWSSTGVAVRRRAEGLHSRSGRVADFRHHRSGAGHGLRQARRVSGPGRGDHPARIRTSRGWCRRSAAARR